MFLRKRRRFTPLSLLGAALLLGGLLWIIGVIWYATALPRSVGDATRTTDAIVVLTGGSERLTKGLELLSAQRARKLFISGVYRGVDISELFRVRQESPDEFTCCVALGHEADNTEGNATETAAWMKDQGFRSLRLVTASYHMPRSLLEFHHAMPELEIVPHPVFPAPFKGPGWWQRPSNAQLVAVEFTKYLIARLRTFVSFS